VLGGMNCERHLLAAPSTPDAITNNPPDGFTAALCLLRVDSKPPNKRRQEVPNARSDILATPPRSVRCGLGSEGGIHLNAPIVGIAATPDGHGYWEVSADGGLFASATPRSTGPWPVTLSTSR
jgi:hypothetical protein